MQTNRQETEIGGPEIGFRSTLWTRVLAAKDPSSPDRRQALEILIEAYWRPVYLFIRRRGNDVEVSKDLVQGFFTALLERNYLQYVNRDKGRFRSFLLTALEHYVSNEFKRERAQKRGGGKHRLSLDFAHAETEVSLARESSETPDAAFQTDWAIRVLSQAMADLHSEYVATGRDREFELLKPHLSPGSPEAEPYGIIAKDLGISEGHVRKLVMHARNGYRDALLRIVRAYSENDEEAKDEIGDLFSVFS